MGSRSHNRSPRPSQELSSTTFRRPSSTWVQSPPRNSSEDSSTNKFQSPPSHSRPSLERTSVDLNSSVAPDSSVDPAFPVAPAASPRDNSSAPAASARDNSSAPAASHRDNSSVDPADSSVDANPVDSSSADPSSERPRLRIWLQEVLS